MHAVSITFVPVNVGKAIPCVDYTQISSWFAIGLGMMVSTVEKMEHLLQDGQLYHRLIFDHLMHYGWQVRFLRSCTPNSDLCEPQHHCYILESQRCKNHLPQMNQNTRKIGKH